ncbi:MAG: flagellar hook-associated protein FlgK [Rhizobiales bacterium]|nr:flagellar hook-associated protein FlgK [Hyphomicrobiales bacterium]
MTLSSALGAAMSGLNTSQAGIDLVSRNIANASTPGYTRKILPQENAMAGGDGIGVRREAAQRQVDSFLQQQLRTESAKGAYQNILASMTSRIDGMFGSPDSDTAISSTISSLSTRLQELANNPEDSAYRQSFLNDASNIAAQLNDMSDQVQSMRLESEQNIGAAVKDANDLLAKIADINQEISLRQASNVSVADLQDERDNSINELSKLMGLKVVDRNDGTVTIFTTGGQLLLDREPAVLKFDEHTSINAGSVYDKDSSKRGVGTITLTSGSTTIDLLATGAFKTGTIAGYVNTRDNVLPEAQAQLDELASQLALAMSRETVPGTAATSGASSGFDLDIESFLSGNTSGATGQSLQFSYTDGTGTHNVSVLPVSDASVLPLAGDATAKAGDDVIGVYVGPTTTAADIAAAISASLPSSVTVSASGTTLSVLDDGLGSTTINSASTTLVMNADTFSDGPGSSMGLALFVDGSTQATYTGAIGTVSQKTGFASRIQVNQALYDDDSRLVAYSATTLSGDNSRILELNKRLTTDSQTYSSATGIGSATTPYTGSIDAFARRLVSYQSSQAANAESNTNSQETIVNALQERFDGETGVNVDDELSNLLILQNAYSANARVMTTIQELFQVLMSIGR